MGKRIIFSDVDFSENAIPVAKAIDGTSSPQYVYVANVANPSQSFNWNAHKVEIQVNSDGSITSLNLPNDVIAMPRFGRGAADTNNWLKEIDFTYLHLPSLVSFYGMLSGCAKLSHVVIGGSFQSLTGTNAVQYMFYNSLNSEVVIDKSFEASNLTDLHQMFYLSALQKVTGLKNLIKSSIVTLKSMFELCRDLEDIDFSDCDTSNVESFSRMFAGCTNLKTLRGINTLDTHNVLDYSYMFSNAGNIGILDISNWNIAENANTNRMFVSSQIYEINANCFTALYGDITGMFYATLWNTIHLDNLNDVSAVTTSDSLFSSYVTGTPKVTIANVTNSAVKTLLINALNTGSVGGSSNWHEDTVDGVLCLVP